MMTWVCALYTLFGTIYGLGLHGSGVLQEPRGVPERAGQLEVPVRLRLDGEVVRRHLLPHSHAPLRSHNIESPQKHKARISSLMDGLAQEWSIPFKLDS